MSSYGTEQVGRVLGTRYRLDAPVGSGSSATVYRAADLQLHRTVAVKVLHPALAEDAAFLARFRAEAQAAATLSHPYVMAVYDWGEADGRPYLVSEYLAGGSLRGMLDVGRRLTPSQALVVGLEAARGLDHAHKHGLVHRDIKPANLLFGDDGRLRIADFGIARALADAAWTDPAGVLLSTARYAAPEQVRGQDVDGKADVYALALTLVEAVTGRVPFAADTTVATLMARLDKLMPVSAELGPLAAVLERAGRPEPADRFDAAGLGRALVATAGRLPRPGPLPLVPTDVDGFREPGPAREFGPSGESGPARGPGPSGESGPSGGSGPFRDADGPTEVVPRPDATAVAPMPPAARTSAPAHAGGAPEPGGTTVARPPVRIATSGPAAAPPVIYDADRDDEFEPSRWGRRVLVALGGLVVVAAVALAAFLYIDATRPTEQVAAVVGLSEAQARNVLETAGFEVAVERQRRDGTQQGSVLEQDPAAGVERPEGATVVVVVSDGAELKALPELTNLPVADAQTQLGTLLLTLGAVTPERSEDVERDRVIRWSVPGQGVLTAGTEVVSGTPVDLVVSSGPAPRDVPDLAGLPYDQAVAALADPAVRLVAARGPDEFNRTVAAGLVVGTNPPAGTAVERDSGVSIIVSLGPDYVTVPNVVGLTLAQARETLLTAGLVPGNVSGQAEPVVGTSVAAGATAIRGDRVDIVLGTPPPPTLAPAPPTG